MSKAIKLIGYVLSVSGMMLFYKLTSGFFLPFIALSLVTTGTILVMDWEDKQ